MALRSHIRHISFLFIVLVAITYSLPSNAATARFSGAYLREMCSIDKQGREKVPGGFTACQAYISGVVDYHNVLGSLNLAPRVDICIPDGVKMWDLHKTVLIFLNKTHTHDAFVAAPAVTMALHEQYPCAKKRR